jgi:hypothetical protein
MKPANPNLQGHRLPASSGQTDKLNQTNLFAQRASKRTKPPFSVLLPLGLGAMTYLCGCDVTVREPGIVVTPPSVAVETPGVVVETPGVVVDTPPVVLEEGVGVVAPVGVDFVFIGGRYAWFDPGIGGWYYRPMGWRPGPGIRVREARDLRELGRIHPDRRGRDGRPDVRRGQERRPDVRQQPGKGNERKQPAKQTARPQEQKKAPKKEEKKKE